MNRRKAISKNIRGNDSDAQKKRLEKKRGMKLDDHPQFKKEEVEHIDEADSLAAMAARREKRLARQRKQMGTSSTGQDFGHDYGISSAERKKRQQAEFDKFVGKKTQKEGVKFTDEEISRIMEVVDSWED
jgi:FKBP-type peptidyl-prolyl cis-trans isomerase